LHPRRAAPLALVLALAAAGCGSSSSSSSHSTTASTPIDAVATTFPVSPAIARAEHPTAAEFPSAAGKTLKQMDSTVAATATLGAATGTFTPGTRRYAFALNTASGAFIYAPTALYIAQNPNEPAIGPLPAAADPMSVPPAYRSQQNAGPGGIKAIYEVYVPLPKAGTYSILAITKTGGRLIGSAGEIAVAPSSPIPDVGQRPPAITTQTLADAPLSLLTTRVPPESMHSFNFGNVLGKQPIALLISTPELCTSRICGPVTDIVVD
jgi:hypothetical protein